MASFPYRGEWPVSCDLGFADTVYSINLMAGMCWDNAPTQDQSESECSSWVDTSQNISMVCRGRDGISVCIDVYDFDADVDLDLRDYAFYQNHFKNLRPF